MKRVLAALGLTLGLALGLVAGPAAAQKKPPVRGAPEKAAVPAKVVACGSLANLRILMGETGGDQTAIKARLADPKADHLGCADSVDIGTESRYPADGHVERVQCGRWYAELEFQRDRPRDDLEPAEERG